MEIQTHPTALSFPSLIFVIVLGGPVLGSFWGRFSVDCKYRLDLNIAPKFVRKVMEISSKCEPDFV